MVKHVPDTLFTFIPKLGKISTVAFQFDDESQIVLEGETLRQWVEDYVNVVNIITSISNGVIVVQTPVATREDKEAELQQIFNKGSTTK